MGYVLIGLFIASLFTNPARYATNKRQQSLTLGKLLQYIGMIVAGWLIWMMLTLLNTPSF